jgi:hypothetical protein
MAEVPHYVVFSALPPGKEPLLSFGLDDRGFEWGGWMGPSPRRESNTPSFLHYVQASLPPGNSPFLAGKAAGAWLAAWMNGWMPNSSSITSSSGLRAGWSGFGRKSLPSLSLSLYIYIYIYIYTRIYTRACASFCYCTVCCLVFIIGRVIRHAEGRNTCTALLFKRWISQRNLTLYNSYSD